VTVKIIEFTNAVSLRGRSDHDFQRLARGWLERQFFRGQMICALQRRRRLFF